MLTTGRLCILNEVWLPCTLQRKGAHVVCSSIFSFPHPKPHAKTRPAPRQTLTVLNSVEFLVLPGQGLLWEASMRIVVLSCTFLLQQAVTVLVGDTPWFHMPSSSLDEILTS